MKKETTTRTGVRNGAVRAPHSAGPDLQSTLLGESDEATSSMSHDRSDSSRRHLVPTSYRDSCLSKQAQEPSGGTVEQAGLTLPRPDPFATSSTPNPSSTRRGDTPEPLYECEPSALHKSPGITGSRLEIQVETRCVQEGITQQEGTTNFGNPPCRPPRHPIRRRHGLSPQLSPKRSPSLPRRRRP